MAYAGRNGAKKRQSVALHGLFEHPSETVDVPDADHQSLRNPSTDVATSHGSAHCHKRLSIQF